MQMQRLFTIKKTQLQMVVDRGYVIPSSEARILTMSFEEFQIYFTQEANRISKSPRTVLSKDYRSLLLPKADANGNNYRAIKVFFAGKDDVGNSTISINVVKSFENELATGKFNDEPAPVQFTEAIMINDSGLSPQARTHFEMIKDVSCQAFLDSDLMYNPTRHVDTPRHEILSKEETTELLRNLKVTPNQLLLIKENDAVVRYYGWKAGGVVRVYRYDQALSVLTQRSINYRYIVKM